MQRSPVELALGPGPDERSLRCPYLSYRQKPLPALADGLRDVRIKCRTKSVRLQHYSRFWSRHTPVQGKFGGMGFGSGSRERNPSGARLSSAAAFNIP